jgi:negative regulator of flagellin synthesis FlgM
MESFIIESYWAIALKFFLVLPIQYVLLFFHALYLNLKPTEGKCMFNQMSDSTHIESDDSLKTTQLEINKILTEGALSYDENISNAAKQLEAIKKSLEEVPEVNEARVLYFKAEIKLGNYQINSEKIAAKMLHAEE